MASYNLLLYYVACAWGLGYERYEREVYIGDTVTLNDGLVPHFRIGDLITW